MPKKNDDFFKQKKVWSEIKDELLGCYLTPYFNKIFYTRNSILYLDGFAGKGKFDDGKNGSPLTALDCLNTSISQFRGNHSLPTINIIFIELNHANDLTANLPTEHQKRCRVISGKFEEQVIPVLQKAAESNNKQNVFIYIDPYGVKALDIALFNALPTIFETAELLINFNSFGLFRMACAARKVDFREEKDGILTDLDEYDTSVVDTAEEVNVIAGGEYWQDIVDRYNKNEINGYVAEKELSHQYKMRLRDKYNYVLDMPIRLKAGHHPKYRMIYATNHPDGCVLMAENIAKRTDDLVIGIQKGGQMSLFPETAENEFVSQDVLDANAKTLLNNYSEYIKLKNFLADFYNEFGVLCPPSALAGKDSALSRLEKSGWIDVKRTPPTTEKTGKASSFWGWQERDGKLVEIKRICSQGNKL